MIPIGLNICVLNSGSSGNSTVIYTGKTSIMLDAGLSGKETVKRLNEIGLSPNQFSGILVSHGHRDHTSGVGVLARRFKIPVFLNKKTHIEISPYVGEIPILKSVRSGSSFDIGDIQIETFSVSHDSSDPMGFIFKSNHSRIAHITDLGNVTPAILKKIRDMDLIVIESNHDIDMLINGSYPEYLKRRILGPKGHLSNIAAANALVEAIGSITKAVILAHLSEDNNHPDLVHSTVHEILEEEGLGDIALTIASRYSAIPVINISEL
ncbi:MAG: MBL fold metallo-hydrolase [Thermoplasmata archaeon]|nr:MAG: MBL fold metallo-hydrolase [Thermoplasmata archaeon]